MKQFACLVSAVLSAGVVAAAFADGAGDNIPEKVRPVPPPGVAVPAADQAALEQGLAEFGKEIESLRSNPRATPYLADVEIFHKAVRYALQFHEFFNPNEIQRAKDLLKQGRERAHELAQGQMPWTTQTGGTVLGYVSEVDGSVQPYGLYIPPSYSPTSPQKYRLDTWFHGRGETISEVNFLSGAQRGGGPFVRPNTFTVQPYGRFNSGYKLAGEVDLLEALKDIKRRYPIDDDRVFVRGFSLGGAGTWLYAAHYSSDWAGAAPGAGFSETPDFLKVYQKETLKPAWWEERLWMMYDCPYYSANFFNLPTVAYSGEIDSQKQAADIMVKALGKEGIRLVHIIGPKTAHAYHPQSVPIINRLVDSIAEHGRQRVPKHVKLSTPILKYNRQAWVTVDGMNQEWKVARVDAQIVSDHEVAVKTENVSAISFDMPSGFAPLDTSRPVSLVIDGQKLSVPQPWSDRSWSLHLHRDSSRWAEGPVADDGSLRKKHDLQGPIDDAFMQSFMIVRPTGTALIPETTKWVDSELQHAISEWRRQMRGDARIKNDTDVTDADIAAHNLALWGDPGSNRILARIADRLPIKWTRDGITVGKKHYAAGTHVPILVYPNPLNPKKYVVLNSGFTYREYDYLNNAREVPKLPDWAIVDITTPPNSRYPGKVVDANFFDERWGLVEGPLK